MSWLRGLRVALRERFDRRRVEEETEEEIEAFLALDAEAREARGSSAPEALRQARAAFGSRGSLRERLRDARLGAWLDSLVLDLRYGGRLLRRSPGFALAAIATLALGIGANTAVLSVVRSVLLAPLPFEQSERLVRLLAEQTLGDGERRTVSVAPRQLDGVRQRARSLVGVVGQHYRNLTLGSERGAQRVVGIEVSEGWAETLGVEPILGRLFDPQEQSTPSSVVLLSHAFWQGRLGGDREIVGSTLQLDDDAFTVIGVLPPQFRYPYHADLWLPAVFDRDRVAPGDLNVFGRLAPGASLEQVGSELDSIADALEDEVHRYADMGLVARPFAQEFRRDPDRSVALLAGAVGLVFLLACVNVASLLLARGATRRRESAVRGALGGGRARQMRQLLTESLVLTLISGALGALLAYLAAGWLEALIPARLGEVVGRIEIDGVALGIGAALSVAAAMVCGLLPAWRATRIAPMNALRSGPAQGTGGGRLLDALVAVEIAFALVLLVGASALGSSFLDLVRADVGYDPDGLSRVQLGLPQPAYEDPSARVAFVSALEERLGAEPGIAGAGLTSMHPVPGTTTNVGTHVAIDGRHGPDDVLPVLNLRLVTPGYLNAVGVRTLRGRGIGPEDVEGATPVAVISQSAAEKLWPGREALQATLRPGGLDSPEHTIIGVVADIAEPEEDLRETLYLAYAQATPDQAPGTWSTTSITLVARSPLPSPRVVQAIRAATREVDPAVPLFDEAAMSEVLAVPRAGQRFGAQVMSSFGVFGLLLAALGAYGVTALAVARRLPELGLRAALGAAPRQLAAGVLAHGVRLVAAGMVAGVVLGAALIPVLGTGAGVELGDPRTAAMAIVTLGLAALLACWLPVRRVLRVDPVRVLRRE